MVGACPPATRPRSGQFAQRSAPRKSLRRRALERIPAHDGPGRRPIEVSERNFFAELKRRNVYKVAVAYIVAGWALSQGIAQVFPVFAVPNWIIRLIVLLAILGLPTALMLAGMFEITPEGLKPT